VHSLIPNAPTLSRHLTTFARACGATEVVLFERTTFLVIATSEVAPPAAPGPLSTAVEVPSPSHATPSSRLSLATSATSGSDVSASADLDGPPDAAALHGLEPTRYERTSELIKAFKHACARTRSEFHALEFEFPEFTAVLDEMTKNMYVLVIVHDPTIGGFGLVNTSTTRSCTTGRDCGHQTQYRARPAQVRGAADGLDAQLMYFSFHYISRELALLPALRVQRHLDRRVPPIFTVVVPLLLACAERGTLQRLLVVERREHAEYDGHARL
jgi:hypothetical protein